MKRLPKKALIGKDLISSSKKHIGGHYMPHFHDFYEIEYIIRGNGSCTINGQETLFSEGMLFFMTPVDSHSVQTDGAEIFNIMFSEQLVDFRQLEPFLEQLFAEITENESNTAYSSGLMNCLLLKLAQFYPQPKSTAASDTLAKIHSFILNNYRNRITLDTVASHVGLTPSYTSSLFKSEMQIGFKSYLNSLRLEYARKLLIYTEASINQICAESGFEDVPNFFKRFKAYYGMTPGTLRRQQTDPPQAHKDNACLSQGNGGI